MPGMRSGRVAAAVFSRVLLPTHQLPADFFRLFVQRESINAILMRLCGVIESRGPTKWPRNWRAKAAKGASTGKKAPEKVLCPIQTESMPDRSRKQFRRCENLEPKVRLTIEAPRFCAEFGYYTPDPFLHGFISKSGKISSSRTEHICRNDAGESAAAHNNQGKLDTTRPTYSQNNASWIFLKSFIFAPQSYGGDN